MASDTSATLDLLRTDPSLVTVQLHAEELAVSKRRVASGLVRVAVATRSHDEAVDEVLHHERVLVERVTINQPVETVPPLRVEGDTTILSVVEEIVVVTRQLILKEEVRVRRIQVTEVHHEVVTLREQEAVITRVATDAGISGSAESLLTLPSQPAVQENDA